MVGLRPDQTEAFAFLFPFNMALPKNVMENLVQFVRQCVREELNRRSSGQDSLIQRTRQLVSSSASFLSKDLSEVETPDRGASMLPSVSTSSSSSAGKKALLQQQRVYQATVSNLKGEQISQQQKHRLT